MLIPLDNIEFVIDEEIMNRGLDYFKKGKVELIKKESNGIIEANVSGNSIYNVRLKIDDNVLTDHSCNCPYSFGPICKHIAAVIIKMKSNENDPEKHKSTKASTPVIKKKREKNNPDPISATLDNLSMDELKEFVRTIAEENPELRKKLLNQFAINSGYQPKSYYSKEIRSLIQRVKRGGFIDWSGARNIGQEAQVLIERAKIFSDKGNYSGAIEISCAIIEELTKALNFADDSNGDVNENIYDSVDILLEISKKGCEDSVRKKLLDYCFKTFREEVFKDWDWHLSLLEIAAELAELNDEIETLHDLLYKYVHSEYSENRIAKLKLGLLEKSNDENKIQYFILNNLHINYIRHIAVQNAVNNKDFSRAISLSKDGVKQDQGQRMGYVNEWITWLYEIAVIQSDTDKIIEYARVLFFNDLKWEKDYYKILKKYVPPEDWSQFVEDLLIDMRKASWCIKQRIPRTYIEEKMWGRLMSFLKANPDVNDINQYAAFLYPQFKEELHDVYENLIISEIKNGTGKQHYKTIVTLLETMKKMDGETRVSLLVERLKSEFAKRPALIDVLKTI